MQMQINKFEYESKIVKEKKENERRKNILVLILRYLVNMGMAESAFKLQEEANLDIEKPYFPKLRERIGKLTKDHNPEWTYDISRTITNAICGLSNLADIKSVICHILFDEPDNEEESEIFRMADFRAG